MSSRDEKRDRLRQIVVGFRGGRDGKGARGKVEEGDKVVGKEVEEVRGRGEKGLEEDVYMKRGGMSHFERRAFDIDLLKRLIHTT